MAQELPRFEALPFDKLQEIGDQELVLTVVLTQGSIQQVPARLEESRRGIQALLDEKPPDYKKAVDTVSAGLSIQSAIIAKILEGFDSLGNQQRIPAEFRNYIAQSRPRFQAIGKLCDEFVARIEQLGKLNLDDLRSSLRQQNPLLVMGPDEIRVISFSRMWQPDAREVRFIEPNARIRPRFAGEQQITAAMLEVTAKTKRSIVFVRPGGAPLADGGPLTAIAELLQRYNFDVKEKDASGQFAMQAMMQRRPPPEEPSEEEMKKAVWVVLALPTGMGPMGPPPSFAPQLKAHLEAGGRAMVLAFPEADNLRAALEPWGINLRTDLVAMRTAPEAQGDSDDLLERFKRMPMAFDVRDYGDHPITRPLRDLESFLFSMTLCQVTQAEGVTVTPLIALPDQPDSWGESDPASWSGEQRARFDRELDLPGAALGGQRLHAGAAAERDGGGRLVVLGLPTLISGEILRWPDAALLRRTGIVAPRYPANSELFLNSIFWLSDQDAMISISAISQSAPRISSMSAGTLGFWRLGFVLILMPLAALGAGVWMWWRRRD